MQTRFTSALGVLTAATLLSGSAYAFAPEFTGDLPTVVITDALTAGASNAAPFDAGTPSATTVNLFRFNNAFDLLPTYIDANGNADSTLRFTFNEFANGSGSGDFSAVSSQRTLAINGVESLLALPTNADFTGANSGDLTANGANAPLSFRNIDLSPGTGTGPFDTTGDVTGINIASGAYRRFVKLYVQSTNVTTPFDASKGETFLVVTEKSDVAGNLRDSLSAAFVTDPFVTVYDSDTTPNRFGGWKRQQAQGTFGQNQFGQVPRTGLTNNGGIDFEAAFFYPATGATTTGFTYTPTALTAAAGTTSLTAAIAGNQIGLGGWEGSGAAAAIPALDANSLYRLRVRASSSNDNTHGWLRIHVGATASNQHSGRSILVFNNSANDIPGTPMFSAGTPPAGKGYPRLTTGGENIFHYIETEAANSVDQGVLFEVIELAFTASTQQGNELTVSEVELSKASRADLGDGTVILNRGGVVPTPLGAGEVAPSATGLTGFVRSGTTAGVSVISSPLNDLNAANTVTGGNADVITIAQTPSANTAAGAIFPQVADVYFSEPFAFGVNPFGPSASYAFPATEGKLYLVDFWMSNATPAANNFGDARAYISISDTFQVDALWTLDTVGLDGFSPTSGTGIGTAPKAYTLAFQPQIYNNNGTEGVNLHFTLQRFFRKVTTASTLNIHRIVVTEYTAPGTVAP